MATKTQQRVSLTENQKYLVADAIVACSIRIDPAMIAKHRNNYFREIIQSQIKLNSTVGRVCDLLDEDSATHVTNLVLNRMEAPQMVRTIASISTEEEA